MANNPRYDLHVAKDKYSLELIELNGFVIFAPNTHKRSSNIGRISIAIKGELYYNLSLDDVRMMLIDELRPKREDELEEEDDVYEEKE